MLSPVALLRKRAAMYPDRPALAVGDAVLDYGQWLRQAEAAATHLADAGVCSGDVVVLRFSLESFLPYAAAYAATLDLGAVAVPAATELRDDEYAGILQACGANWTVFADPEAPEGIGLERTGLDDLREERAPRGGPSPTDVAEIIFTSGTTGEPQGVLCPYGEIGFDYDLTPPEEQGDRGRSIEAHAAAFGTNFCQEMLRGPLKWGSFVVTLPRFGADALSEAMKRHEVTTLRLAPVMAQMLVRTTEPGGLGRITEISVSSAFCPPAVLDKLQAVAPRALVVNQYSLTESGRAKMKLVWGEGPREALGRPVEGTEVRIVGEDGAVPARTEGEIQIRHVDAVPRRYLRRDRRTDGVPAEPAWVSTGDIGYVDDDGYVFLLDRARDLVNVGGRKVSPLAVERVLAAQPGVAEVAVCGIPHPTLGEVVAALIVPHDTAADTSFDFASVLHHHESPKRVVIGTELPRNRAGKVVRDEVRSQILAGSPPSAAPTGEDESALAETFKSICARILERPVVDLDVSWYAAGGDSMSALELLTTIEDDFGVELPVELFSGEFGLRDMLIQLQEGGR
ncbi:AMP-binding protein [Glycomyces rhizosphaerae]|uniref:AMP-binding protein n=1 Tax=Glycomyces rhizosphaerae TaxID=2054422 RepID=A0ABV7Q4V2_9ACTN